MDKSMDETFAVLQDRVLDALVNTNHSDIVSFFGKLRSPTICTASGGSMVAGQFISKVLNKKNAVVCTPCYPRETLYMNTTAYENILCISYSGKNAGVKVSFDSACNRFLLTGNPELKGSNNTLVYNTTMPEECSYISLAGTLIPMAIALEYYLDGKKITLNFIKNAFNKAKNTLTRPNLTDVTHIVGGYEVRSAMTFLETTLAEANISTPIVSEKYDFTHGRCNLSHNNPQNEILYFVDEKNELDDMFFKLSKHKVLGDIKAIKTCGKDVILNDFIATIQSMYIAKDLAKQRGVDMVTGLNKDKEPYYISGGVDGDLELSSFNHSFVNREKPGHRWNDAKDEVITNGIKSLEKN